MKNETDDPRRRLLIQALAMGLLPGGLAAGEAMAQQIFGSRPSRLPAGRSIYRINGGVTVDGKAATLESQVTPTSTIETAKDGEIVYVNREQAFIQRGNTRVVLETAQRQEGVIASGIRLLSGALLSVFPRGNPVRIQTKTATVGIRGTGVYLESDPEQTYFCTCYGVADVTANDDPESKDTVVAKHHDRPLYIVSGAPKGQNIRRAGFVNHTDQELMLVETLVGRTPPFVFPKDAYQAPRREY